MNEIICSLPLICQAAVLGFGKKRSMMELQNLQEALKVEIQIHQVFPQPSPHTIWMECVIVAAAVPSLSSRCHCIGMYFPLMRMLKLPLSSLQKLVSQMKQDPQVRLPH